MYTIYKNKLLFLIEYMEYYFFVIFLFLKNQTEFRLISKQNGKTMIPALQLNKSICYEYILFSYELFTKLFSEVLKHFNLSSVDLSAFHIYVSEFRHK